MLTDRELLNMAREAARDAYVPYSRFPVGTALECEDGAVFTGCNIENSALGATLCAEQVAIAKAVSEGRRRFLRIAVYGEGEDYCMPCGTCRQMLAEFAGEQDLEILCTRSGGRYVSYHLSQLLPHPYVL